VILPLLMLLAAQDAPADCENPVTQLDMNECAYRDVQAEDAELNKQWRITYARMKRDDADYNQTRDRYDTSADSAPALLESQRAWLKYREGQCTAESNRTRGGSMRSMLYSMCMTHLTNARTAQLAELMKEEP
jgi:uncharacterized protein YecT (DUF1311 family)